jgi:hypothetical protein
MTVQGLTWPGPISDAATNTFTVTRPTMDAPPALDFGTVDTVLSYELNRMFDVKQVRANDDERHRHNFHAHRRRLICEIRRPAVEWFIS